MGIIKNAGYLWNRKFINWQEKPKLIGIPEKCKFNKDGREVDFAYQAAVYALYNQNLDCIYIGQAGSGENEGLFHRLRAHTNDYMFCAWDRFSWFGFYSIDALEKDRSKKKSEKLPLLKRPGFQVVLFLPLIVLMAGDLGVLVANEAMIVVNLGITAGQIGYVIGIQYAVNGVFTFLFGYLSDKFSRKKLLIIGGGCLAGVIAPL